MKILKYTFEIPKLVVDDGELVELGSTKETYTFTLLFKGVSLYEKLAGKALLTDLSKYGSNNTQIDVEMVKNLACASYVKIENDTFHQNMVTADEFSKTDAFSHIGTDTEFMTKLLEMVMDCCLSENQKTTLKEQASKK